MRLMYFPRRFRWLALRHTVSLLNDKSLLRKMKLSNTVLHVLLLFVPSSLFIFETGLP